MVKKVIVLLVAAFAIYYLLAAPVGAAELVSSAFDATMGAFGQVFVFLDQLTT